MIRSFNVFFRIMKRGIFVKKFFNQEGIKGAF